MASIYLKKMYSEVDIFQFKANIKSRDISKMDIIQSVLYKKKGWIDMKGQFTIYTAKNGERYIQTKSKYLAHGLNYIGFRFMVFKENNTGTEIYSFSYSEELLAMVEHIMELRKPYNLNQSKSTK